MVLVLEIWLTVSAWRKGWKAWTIGAWVIGLGVGMMLVSAALATGTPASSAQWLGIVGDVIIIAILGLMVANPRTEQAPSASRSAAQPQTRTSMTPQKQTGALNPNVPLEASRYGGAR